MPLSNQVQKLILIFNYYLLQPFKINAVITLFQFDLHIRVGDMVEKVD